MITDDIIKCMDMGIPVQYEFEGKWIDQNAHAPSCSISIRKLTQYTWRRRPQQCGDKCLYDMPAIKLAVSELTNYAWECELLTRDYYNPCRSVADNKYEQLFDNLHKALGVVR